MNELRDAAERAIKSWDEMCETGHSDAVDDDMNALREALSAEQQEPMADEVAAWNNYRAAMKAKGIDVDHLDRISFLNGYQASPRLKERDAEVARLREALIVARTSCIPAAHPTAIKLIEKALAGVKDG